MSNLYDAIVVGLGGVGAFALRSLAKRNSNVLGLERFHIAHELGSSHGATRLFRHAYFEHPSYIPLCLKSTESFQELSDWKKNRNNDAIPLLETCGVLVVSDGGNDGTYEVIERCSESATIFGIPTQMMETEDLRSEYGSCFAIPENENKLKGILEPGAGFVRPELAIKYAIEDALSHGAELQEGLEVKEILKEDASPSESPVYLVHTSDGAIHRTRGVIVSAGAWASKLLPELKPYLTVTRQVQAWFELPHADNLPPVGWFLDRAKDRLPFYGIPADPQHEKHPLRSKVAIHGRTVRFDPETWEGSDLGEPSRTLKRPKVTNEELDELKDLIQDWIPGAADGIVQAKACLYTMTPDEHFIVDRKEGSSNIWYAAGLSGHGFKMTPALGQALADLVVDGKSDLPVDFLRRDRFQTTKSIS